MVRPYLAFVILGLSALAQAANDPGWAQLSAADRQVLAPLGSEWDGLRPWQREKMLNIAHDYPKNVCRTKTARAATTPELEPHDTVRTRKYTQGISTIQSVIAGKAGGATPHLARI